MQSIQQAEKTNAWNAWRNLFVLSAVAFVIAYLYATSSLLVGVVAAMIGVLLMLVAFKLGRMQILTDSEGIRVRGRGVDLHLEWKAMVVCSYNPKVGTGAYLRPRLFLSDGNTQIMIGFEMGDALVGIKTCQKLAALALHNSRDSVLSKLLAQYRASGQVKFGAVNMSAAGLTVGKATLPWTDIGDIRLTAPNLFDVYSKRTGKIWYRTRMAYVTNAHFLDAFIRELSARAQSRT